MKTKADDLVKESLSVENDFSSSSHVLDTLVSEGEPAVQEYEIPTSYNKDTLRLLMVNTEKYFVYWEVSEETIKNNSIDVNKEKFSFIVVDNSGNELYSFESSFALGDYYIKSKFENMDISVKAGVIKDGKFVELMNSNVVHTFSSEVNYPSEEDEVWIRKRMGWTEVVRTTIEHANDGVSSAKYVEELERIKHIIEEDEEQNKFSSSSMSSTSVIK